MTVLKLHGGLSLGSIKAIRRLAARADQIETDDDLIEESSKISSCLIFLIEISMKGIKVLNGDPFLSDYEKDVRNKLIELFGQPDRPANVISLAMVKQGSIPKSIMEEYRTMGRETTMIMVTDTVYKTLYKHTKNCDLVNESELWKVKDIATCLHDGFELLIELQDVLIDFQQVEDIMEQISSALESCHAN